MLQFTKLRIAGFKSFVDPTELLIEPGLTGVVGPNGCGKSNLIEALRWVMGESSARQMRGGEMDDVIFAGSSERASRNIAEVILELDNGARSAPPPWAEHEELHVSRRIDRSKGSTYRVNGREVRARDVQLLFADAAAGARSAAMVTQGQVSQLIAAKPVERRALLEEAAGVTGLNSRRHEALLRLQAAEANLQRLDDVLATLDAQSQQLRRQARQATRYREVSARIRALEAATLWLKWHAADTALRAAREGLAAAGHAVEAANTAVTRTATEQASAAAELPTVRSADADAAAALQQLASERDALDAEARQVARDAEVCAAQVKQTGDDLRRERSRADEAAATIERLATERARLAALREGEPAVLAQAQQALAATVQQVATLDGEATALTERLAGNRARRDALVRARNEAAGAAERLARRDEELARQHRAAEDELARLADPASLAATVNAAETTVSEARSAAAVAEAARADTTARQADAAAALRLAETAHARLTAEETALAEVLAASPGNGAGDDGPALLDMLRVDAGLETALVAALGDDLLATTDETAPARWRRQPEDSAGSTAAPLPEDLPSLARHVQAPPELARRLAAIAVVDDEAQGDRLQPSLHPGQRLATRDGALWRWDGFARRGGAETPAAVRLRQRARLDALRPQVAEAAAARSEVAARHEAVRTEAADAARRDNEARAALRTAEPALARARQALAEADVKRARIDDRLATLTQSAAALAAERSEAEGRLRALAAEWVTLPDDAEEQRQLDGLRAELSRLRSQQMQQQGRIDTLQREQQGRTRRLQAIGGEIAAWTSRLDGFRQQVQTLADRLQHAEAELARLQALPGEIGQRRNDLLERLEAADARRKTTADALSQAEARLAEADRQGRLADRTLAAAREDRIRAEAADSQATDAAAAVAALICERLDVRTTASPHARPHSLPDSVLQTLAEQAGGEATVGTGLKEADLGEQERRLERLRRDRELMGPVNLRAAEEMEALQAQVTDLQTQREDLLQAIAKLRRGVSELDKEGRERLAASFAEIDRHFQALFGRLFGGGQARLSLVDSDDLLSAGLEVLASPPGKKLQLMTLLSGGEQTLTALALRFAMFLIRPAPICVLDEVDAALDDANVDRFCSLLGDLAGSGTRFLVITHHRLTMARMDRLFGVTMLERGASRLVSVDLSRAEVLRQTA